MSRSKLELFLNCPRCFYLDRRLGVGQPPGFPFNLNSAVDALLKREFDHYRALGEPHPLMKQHGIDAVPFRHEKMEEWRDSLRRGVTHPVPGTNLILTGGVDDLWWNETRLELFIVDYKATSKLGEVNLDADWQVGYKRQAEIYQWLFRQNGFRVSDTSYFVYCNGKSDRARFDRKLEFDIKILPYSGDCMWVGQAVLDAHTCLTGDRVPPRSAVCAFCTYTRSLEEVLNVNETLGL